LRWISFDPHFFLPTQSRSINPNVDMDVVVDVDVDGFLIHTQKVGSGFYGLLPTFFAMGTMKDVHDHVHVQVHDHDYSWEKGLI